MNSDTFEQESCGPQLMPKGDPTIEWGVQELGVYAQVQHRQIVGGETSLSAAYWRLGLALNLARKQFGRKQWQPYLDDLGIDKTRASKARAIQRTFDEVGQVADLSVEDAYAHRERKPHGKTKKSAASGRKMPRQTKAIRTFAAAVCKKAQSLVDEAAFAESEDAVVLVPAVRNAIEQLQGLLKLLETQATPPKARTDDAAQGSGATSATSDAP